MIPILAILATALPMTKWHRQSRPPSMRIGVTLLTVRLTYLFRAVFDLDGYGLAGSSTFIALLHLRCSAIALSSLDWKRAWI